MSQIPNDLFPGRAKKNSPTIGDGNISEILLDMSYTYNDMMKEIEKEFNKENSVIDEKYLYIDPVSVYKWTKLIKSDEYVTYRNCKAVLEVFLQSNTWLSAIQNGSISTIVDLGVGAGRKDHKIIQSLIDNNVNGLEINYTMIDTSFPMLETTLESLIDEKLIPNDKIRVYTIRSDFMKLINSANFIRGIKGNTAFFMLGNTLNNLKEKDFMNSLKWVSEIHDLFIIGLEMYDTDRRDESMTLMLEEYDHRALHDLLLTPLQVFIPEDENLTTNDIEVTRSDDNEYSDIKDHSTILMKYHKKNWTLATSSRYSQHRLVEFMADYGWTKLEVHINRSNPLYRYFVFEKKE